MASAAAGISSTPLQRDSPGWLNEDWLSILTASPASSVPSSDNCNQSSSPSSTRSRLPTLDRASEADLQRRIRALCVTKVQLESVSFFFNTTARCFHLLSTDTNVWRIFFAQLASESPVILDLVGGDEAGVRDVYIRSEAAVRARGASLTRPPPKFSKNERVN